MFRNISMGTKLRCAIFLTEKPAEQPKPKEEPAEHPTDIVEAYQEMKAKLEEATMKFPYTRITCAPDSRQYIYDSLPLGIRGGDVGHILENIVYFELLRRGYEVAIGKVGEKEIDFIATKMNEKKYIQVTDNMNAPETRARELAPLQAVQAMSITTVITNAINFFMFFLL